MDALASADILFFGDFCLDRRGGGLSCRDNSGAYVPVAIGSRALDILDSLIARAGGVVSKDEIIAAVWPGLVVEDSNLTVQMSALRRVLDRGRAQGSCIQTVPGRGYRFVAAVAQPGTEAPSAPDPPRGNYLLQPRCPVLDALAAPAVIRPSSFLTPDQLRAGHTDVPPRMSLVVLPFGDLGDGPDQRFADRLADDLTTDLSRFTHTLVTSRSTALTYRGKSVDAKQIGHELGVRYILEGGVQRFATHLRVNARLIDTRADAYLWAERFDRDPGDLLAVQDELTKHIAVAVYANVLCVEASQPTEEPDALEYVIRGRAAKYAPPTCDSYTEAISLFEHALAADPQSAEAQAWLADALASRAADDMADAGAADLARAEKMAARALAISPRSGVAHFARARVLSAQGRFKDAMPEYEAAASANPDWPHLYGHLSDCKLGTGLIEEALPLAARAIQMSPGNPTIAHWYSSIGRAQLLQSSPDEAILWLEEARRSNPHLPIVHAMLASAYALIGEAERAAAELVEAQQRSLDGRYSSLARLRAARRDDWGVPEFRALFEGTFFVGLRKAGMPNQ